MKELPIEDTELYILEGLEKYGKFTLKKFRGAYSQFAQFEIYKLYCDGNYIGQFDTMNAEGYMEGFLVAVAFLAKKKSSKKGGGKKKPASKAPAVKAKPKVQRL